MSFKIFAKDHKISPTAFDKYTKHQNGLITPKGSMTPYILEERPGNLALLDVFSRLMLDRIIFVGSEIDDITTNMINAQMLYLDTEKSNDPIKLFINSPGGDVYSGSAILDTMDLVKSPVDTVCIGLAASMGAVILGHGHTRKATPRSRIMIHQPWGGAGGNTSQILIAAKEYETVRYNLAETLAIDCKKDVNEVLADCELDKWMSATQAIAYGIIDSLTVIKK